MLVVRCLLGMSVLLLAAGLATRLAGRRWSAGERHAMWTVSLVLSLLLPFLLRIEPPPVAFVSPVLEVQRITISVGPEDRQVDYRGMVWWAWIAGMAGAAGWWLVGFVRVTGMVASSTEHSTYAGVAVRTCAGLKMPAVAAGPVILLPSSADSWPVERLEMVLTHELAHVRRRDLLWRLAGTLACCLYWFHPLAWWAAAQQRKESEMACDDQVLTGNSSDLYAENLVAVAREAAGQRMPAAVMAMAKPRELEGRLMAVLDGSRRRRPVSAFRVLGAAVFGLLLVTPLVAWQDSGVQMKGAVRDVVGVIPGAKVILKGVSEYSFDTGADGAYSVTGVPEGVYSIEVLKPGYSLLAVGGRRIETGKTARADFYLDLGKVRETVTVDGGKGGPSAAPASSEPQRIRVSGNVQAAKIVKMVRPSYPGEAKQAGVQGTVRMGAVIGKEGDVMGLTLLMSPSAELARSAMEAVNQWKYTPTLLNGQPVEIETAVDVNYTLAK
ncbi:MAG: TonB family protein [Bryobacteraceae bacterium]